jgi:hypothetical protein
MANYLSDVTDWILSGMKYQEGISLLISITQKQNSAAPFSGKQNRMHSKLAYEICKTSKCADFSTWKKFITDIQLQRTACSTDLFLQNSNIDQPRLPDLISENLPPLFASDHEKSTSQYPPIIHRIVSKTAELYHERSKTHTQMVNLPAVNVEPWISKRLGLFDQVKAFSQKLEILYSAKKKYDESGVIPTEESIFPSERSIQANPKADLPEIDKLRKRKKDLQTYLHKDKLLLKAVVSKSDPENQSPREITLLSRISDRCEQIDTIEHHIAKLKSKK